MVLDDFSLELFGIVSHSADTDSVNEVIGSSPVVSIDRRRIRFRKRSSECYISSLNTGPEPE